MHPSETLHVLEVLTRRTYYSFFDNVVLITFFINSKGITENPCMIVLWVSPIHHSLFCGTKEDWVRACKCNQLTHPEHYFYPSKVWGRGWSGHSINAPLVGL